MCPERAYVKSVAFPDGVASQDGSVGFLELRTGGVLSLDLDSGQELWTAPLDARPLLALTTGLVVEDRGRSQGNLLQLVILNVRAQGAVDRDLEPVVLPEWVSVSDPEQSFDLEFEAEGELLLISWRAESRYQGGASPPPEIEARARRKFGGEVHVNLGTGHIARNMGRTAKARVERSVDDTPATHDADVIARLTPPGARASSVVNGRLFYLVEPATDGTSPGSRLVCLDLKDGAVRWERMLPGRRVMRAPARRQ